ncbi:MAG: DNA-directed RNA polymerase subunit alpha [Nitrospirae bacterium]|nr:DNA-directed RNA polymerase subunit alpha [Nitrospirota bacterium]
MIIRTKDFQIPKKLEVNNSTQTPTYGEFFAEPFERGFGVTIGNSLRRVLLSSIVGASITTVKIEGVLHEFSTVSGVKEDITDIILTLKSLRLKMYTEKPKTLYIQKRGPGIARGSDIIHDADVEILTPEIVIATLEKDAKLDMELTVKLGRGYVTAEHIKEEGLPIGVIPIDSIFSPVQKVNFRVENARVGRQTDYDRLILEVWTDGSIKPEEAVSHAAKILKDHLNIFIITGDTAEDNEDNEDSAAAGITEDSIDEKEEKRSDLAKNLFKGVDELELSVRSANCLKNANIYTIADLVKKSETDMLETKNFGKKSLNEIKAMLNCMGLSFGMNVDELLENNVGKKA